MTRELVVQLMKALGVPARCRWFELRVAVDEAITIKCEFYPDEGPQVDEAKQELITLVQRYKVVPIE